MLQYKKFLLGWLLALIGMVWSVISLSQVLLKDGKFNWWCILVLVVGYALLIYAIVKESKYE